MRNATYNDIQRLLDNRQPFTGNSASAVYTINETRGTKTYRVFSYSTEIARLTTDLNGVELERSVDSTKYSTTTSRLQNLVRKAWGLN